jgi:peptidoglycan/LPS O-acetylase OafA/YrhL
MSSHHYLNNLTPLRGLAALWVATFHFRGLVNNLFPTHQTMLLEKGYSMVDLFFVMSGFIMIHVHGDDFARKLTKHNSRRFFVARFARLYPLHFFTLSIFIFLAVFSWGWGPVYDPGAILTNLLLLQSFHIDNLRTWNTISWSVSAEWAAYLCFPFLAIMFGQKKKVFYILLPPAIIFIYLALLYWLPSEGIAISGTKHRIEATYNYGFLRGIAGFSLGMLTYGLFCQIRIRNFFGNDLMAFFFVVATLFCMHKDSNDLLNILIFVGLVISFASNTGNVHKLCSFSTIQFAGKVSYSIYLLQTLVRLLFIMLVNDSGTVSIFPPVTFLSRLAYTIAYLILLTSISAITYYGIENPCRNFINRKYSHLNRAQDNHVVSS